MTKKVNHIDAYILAGGKSSRMGSDKGLLLFRGKPMIEGIINQLLPNFERIKIVSANPAYSKFGLEMIEDLVKDIGPAGGIHAALNNTISSQAFIIGCDTPFVTTSAVQYIIERSSDSQITLPVCQGKNQPLFGVYSKNCLPKWEQLIESGTIKLQVMVTHFKLSKVNVDHSPLFNGQFFMNVNDKNDLHKAQQQL